MWSNAHTLKLAFVVFAVLIFSHSFCFAELESTFTTGTDSWKIVDIIGPPLENPLSVAGVYSVNWSSTGGNPGGYIWSTDPPASIGWFFFSAPPSFLGNKSAYYGGILTYDLRCRPVSNLWEPGVVLVGETSTLYYNTNSPPPGWTNYTVPLTPSGWRLNNYVNGPEPSVSVMQSVLGQLRAVYISGDRYDGTETAGLDNVRMISLAERAANLAKQVVGRDYSERGAKGYDFATHTFLSPEAVSELDCSGLILWAYDRAYYGDTQVDWEQAIVTQKCVDVRGRGDEARGWRECMKDKESPIFCQGANEQCYFNSYAISRSDLAPGDVIFIPGKSHNHIVMYVGDGKVVHAAKPSLGIVEEDLDDLEAACAGADIKYRRVKKPDLLIVGHSPIDLVVTDPDGLTISKDLCEVSGAEYVELDMNGDGEYEDYVIISTGKIGDYAVRVVPEPGALPEDTYSLEFLAGDTSGWLAKDVQIVDIPAGGYEFYSDVPEPSALLLLAMGCLALIRHRRPWLDKRSPCA